MKEPKTKHKKIKEPDKPKRKANINLLRRISQVFFFLLLVYGGFLYLKQIDTAALPFVEANPEIQKLDVLAAPQGYTEVFDTYLPFRTCRYLEGNRIFRACSVHYLTEVPAYGVPWYDFIPHFLVIVLLSVLLGRMWCGWVCPLGFSSDIFGYIRKWLRLEYLRLPKKVLEVIKKMRMVWIALLFILAVAIIIPFIGLTAFKNELFLVACQTCPARNLFPLISGATPTWFAFNNPFAIIFSIIGIFFILLLLLGFFGKRIWCRFCPNGIILSWFNKGCLVNKEKDVKKCTKCGICKRVCPMDNEEVYNEKSKKNVNNQNCIDCFTCIDKCPEDDCLQVKFAGKKLFSSRYRRVVDKEKKKEQQKKKLSK